MQLTIGARALWNNQVYFDYFDRAFAIYTADTLDTRTLPYIKLFWDANRSLGGTGLLPTPICTLENAGSPRATYSLDSPREMTFADTTNVERIFYTINGDTPADGATATNFLYNPAAKPVMSTAVTLKWQAFADEFDPSLVGSFSVSFVTAGHPCAPVNLTVV